MTAANAVSPAAWTVTPACVHLWQADAGADAGILGRLRSSLHPEEQARAARFFQTRDRERFLGFRGLLRHVLAGYLGTSPEVLRFGVGARGKPFLEAHPGLQFNLSHAGDRWLLGLTAHCSIGVDIEQVPAPHVVDATAGLVFSEAERSALNRLSGQDRQRCFARLWTRKEAVIKADGRGMWLPLPEIDVWSSEGRARLWHPQAGRWEETGRWTLTEVSAPEGWAAAIAVEGPVTSVVSHTCSDLIHHLNCSGATT